MDGQGNVHSPEDGRFIPKGAVGSILGVQEARYGAGWPENAAGLSAEEKAARRAALDLMTGGGSAWHVAHPSYRPDAALVARDSQPEAGIDTPWKWDEASEGFDGDAVALFPDTPQGRQDAGWLWSDYPDYVLLRVDVPPEDDRLQEMRLLDEGYPAVVGSIPGAWIRVVRRGYADGVLDKDSSPSP